MRSLNRTILRDAIAIAIASGAVGVSFGAIAAGSGLPPWSVVVMSVFIFAGGAQFLAVGLLAAGNPLAALFGGLLINARHLPFGLVVADAIGPRWWQRLLGSHLMIDESVAFALARTDPRERRQAFWATGAMLFVCWNVGTLIGIALGTVVGDPAVLGLDAAFPAGLIALILPSLKDHATRQVTLTGAALAVLTTPLLPAGLPVLLSLAGLLTLALPRRRRTESHDATTTASADSAAGTADSAAGTADSAASTANNADSANSAAKNAAGTADSAAGTADSAAGTADSAAGTADSAAGTADSAAGTADSAAGTADSAAGTADSAAGTADTTGTALRTADHTKAGGFAYADVATPERPKTAGAAGTERPKTAGSAEETEGAAC
ncbi:4-azaleucine resistance transporter AzlC [Catenuloplanes nepalensis]|uniref:4-azaleucine resistance transporter AzlC n=1 Tax=Catenuloplanes nepalensis TaxID=587533 RepID=A0ABT9MKL3_9ACTN|nr:AzlC family ABC transporter permease [Catenuloplanes nepalensis]MDP9791838.1 4-azaleucine resistance transporter AzlC [Catenuloplanes nepalensis]